MIVSGTQQFPIHSVSHKKPTLPNEPIEIETRLFPQAMADSLDHILACQICLEDFEETGDHVPRILPCSHTLCERCLRHLIRGIFMDCPECRKKHRVIDNVRTFPQNKYILTNIRRKLNAAVSVEEPEVDGKISQCEEHGKHLILFCKSEECKKAICQKCLTKYHRGHDVIDVEEEEKETLVKKLDSETQKLATKKGKVLAVKEEVKERNEICLVRLEERKEEHMRIISQKYDELIEEVTFKMNEVLAKIDEEATTIDQHLELLMNIKENMNNDVANHEELTSALETVTTIAESAEINLSGTQMYIFSEYQENGTPLTDSEVMNGLVVRKETVCDLSEPAEAVVAEVREPEVQEPDVHVQPAGITQDTPLFTCTGKCITFSFFLRKSN